MQNLLRIVLLVVLLFTLRLQAATTPAEIWITPATDAGGGIGTIADPFRVTSDTAAAPHTNSFFNLIHDQRPVDPGNPTGAKYVIPENAVIHLTPGTFLVRQGTAAGNVRNALTPKNGWKIRGAGMDITILKVIDNHPAANDGPKMMIIGGGAYGGYASASPVDGVEVSDLTVDSNLQGQSVPHCPTSVGLLGSDNRISRVHAIDWGSTMSSGNECFPLAVGSHYQTRAYRNGIIEDCLVDTPAPVYHTEGTSCVIIGNLSGSGASDLNLGGWIIRGCTVRNITAGTGLGQPLYVHGFGGVGRGQDIHHNFAVNLLGGGIGTYNDSWDNTDIVYRDNNYFNVSAGFVFSTGYWNQTNLVIMNNVITFTNGGSGIGIDVAYGPGGKVDESVRIEGNVITPHVAGTSGTALGIHGDIEFLADNNVIDGGPDGLDFFVSGGWVNYIRPISFRNNHNTRGKPLKIGDWTPTVESKLVGYTDDQLTFTPSAAGWYRILLAPCCGSAGRVDITAEGFTDIALAFHQSLYDGGFAEITQIYNDSLNGYGGVSAVRVAQYDSPGTDEYARYANYTAYGVDIQVASALVGQKITIKGSGTFRPTMGLKPQAPYTGQFEPYAVQATPTASMQLDLGPGIRTTGPIYSGAGGQQITDTSGHVLSSALNIVQPAQGGLGANNSSLAADQFPYTTAIGTFGYSTVTSFARSLLDDADATAARTTLDVPHFVKKTANETVVNNATLFDDAVLKFTMAANTKYTIRVKVFFSAATTPGIKYRITGPASPTLVRRHITRAAGGAVPAAVAIQTAYDTSDVALTGSGLEGIVEEEIIVHNGSTSGDFKFQWAQNTSSSSLTMVRAGSYIQYLPF